MQLFKVERAVSFFGVPNGNYNPSSPELDISRDGDPESSSLSKLLGKGHKEPAEAGRDSVRFS